MRRSSAYSRGGCFLVIESAHAGTPVFSATESPALSCAGKQRLNPQQFVAMPLLRFPEIRRSLRVEPKRG